MIGMRVFKCRGVIAASPGGGDACRRPVGCDDEKVIRPDLDLAASRSRALDELTFIGHASTLPPVAEARR
jgi:hypothetical protein